MASRLTPFPHFWRNPIRYSRWAAHEKPAIFYSLIIGASGPLMLLIVPPIKRRMGVKDPEPIPMTYPSMFSFLLWGISFASLFVSGGSGACVWLSLFRGWCGWGFRVV